MTILPLGMMDRPRLDDTSQRFGGHAITLRRAVPYAAAAPQRHDISLGS